MRILITGATSGIGRATAIDLAEKGHELFVHGRSKAKVDALLTDLGERVPQGVFRGFIADLGDLDEVSKLAHHVVAGCDRLDVLVNNAGVYKTSEPRTASGHDIRFVVNAFAPVLLTERLAPVLRPESRVINLSSAAQQAVDLQALVGTKAIDDFSAYAQSKVAITSWSRSFASRHPDGPMSVAINPGSLLNTRMVREGFNVPETTSRSASVSSSAPP